MLIEIEIITPPDTRERHRCWDTAVPRVFQTIVGEQIINVHVDRENVCEISAKKLPFRTMDPTPDLYSEDEIPVQIMEVIE